MLYYLCPQICPGKVREFKIFEKKTYCLDPQRSSPLLPLRQTSKSLTTKLSQYPIVQFPAVTYSAFLLVYLSQCKTRKIFNLSVSAHPLPVIYLRGKFPGSRVSRCKRFTAHTYYDYVLCTGQLGALRTGNFCGLKVCGEEGLVG